MKNIFISYSRTSRERISAIANDLIALDFEVWYDIKISGGQAWWEEILRQIRDCSVFVFAVDDSSVQSSACSSELEYAILLRKSIVPILLDRRVGVGSIPASLRQLHVVECWNQDKETLLALRSAILRIPESPDIPEVLPNPPAIPKATEIGLREQIDSTSELTHSQQDRIVKEVRRMVFDRKSADESVLLLTRLRERKDLMRDFISEVDYLLEVNSSFQRESKKSNTDLNKVDNIWLTQVLGSVFGLSASGVLLLLDGFDRNWVVLSFFGLLQGYFVGLLSRGSKATLFHNIIMWIVLFVLFAFSVKGAISSFLLGGLIVVLLMYFSCYFRKFFGRGVK